MSVNINSTVPFNAYGLQKNAGTAKNQNSQTEEKAKAEQNGEPTALQKLNERRQQEYRTALSELERIRENREKSEENSKFRDYGKLLKIAMRIMNGDRVPIKDKKALAEAMPDLYRQAEMMKRTNNEHPKKYKSEFKDEEKDSNLMKRALEEGGETNSAAEIINAMSEEA